MLVSSVFLECLNRNLLATLGLKEVHDPGRTLPDFSLAGVLLIINRDPFILNIEMNVLRL